MIINPAVIVHQVSHSVCSVELFKGGKTVNNKLYELFILMDPLSFEVSPLKDTDSSSVSSNYSLQKLS